MHTQEQFVYPTSMYTWPCTFSVSPKRAESKVDFPQPTWPTTAITEPLLMFRLMLVEKRKEIK